MGMKGWREFAGRVAAFQPATWVTHLIAANLVVALVDGLPRAVVALTLVGALIYFGWREWRDYQRHQARQNPAWVWLADGIGDLVGPVTAVVGFFGSFWVAHTVGLFILALGTVAWVGLGYGGRDA